MSLQNVNGVPKVSNLKSLCSLVKSKASVQTMLIMSLCSTVGNVTLLYRKQCKHDHKNSGF